MNRDIFHCREGKYIVNNNRVSDSKYRSNENVEFSPKPGGSDVQSVNNISQVIGPPEGRVLQAPLREALCN